MPMPGLVLPHLDLFGHQYSTFGLMYFLAFVVAYLLAAQRAQELGMPRRWAIEGPLVATAAGLVGARLYFLVEHPEQWSDPLDWNGGNAWYGAFALGFVAVVLWRRWRGIPLLTVLDTGAMVLPFAQALGRFGCQLAGDGDYGVASDLPWAMSYPDGSVPTPPGVKVHPTPIYESIALLAIGIFLWRRRDKVRPGAIAALYLLLAGTERFLVEFIRINPSVAGPFTSAQLWSAVMMVAGAAWLLVLRNSGGLAPNPVRT